MIIPSLTVRQPWAWAIAAGIKRVENRSWITRYRGPLAIHAGRARVDPADEKFFRGLDIDIPGNLIRGAIIAIADLTAIVPSSPGLGPFATGPWCWIIQDVYQITPLPMRGARRLWRVEIPKSFLPARLIRGG